MEVRMEAIFYHDKFLNYQAWFQVANSVKNVYTINQSTRQGNDDDRS
jgi:hypothetical protein